MLCALIMAGGKGTRFWPLSTEDKPKQFLKLIDENTMIQMTVNRLKKLIPIERIFVVTSHKYKELLQQQLPELPTRNIIFEPVGRNTAPCIALSAFIINKYYKNSTLAVVPSDHLIEDENEFIRVLETAQNYVAKNEKAIVTLGMKPTRPETGYGYINFGQNRHLENSHEIIDVLQFVEKPTLEIAEKYIENGNYLWNSGMFVWKTTNILRLTEKYLNSTYNVLKEIAISDDENFQDSINSRYSEVENISVDYAIMEKADNIYVIPCDFGWDDVGSWGAIERYSKKDKSNNVCNGKITTIDSFNNIFISNNKPILAVGLDNVLCVETEDVILILNKENSCKINELRELYKNGD